MNLSFVETLLLDKFQILLNLLNVGECIRGVFFISFPLIEFAFTISSYVGFIGNVATNVAYLTSSMEKLHL